MVTADRMAGWVAKIVVADSGCLIWMGAHDREGYAVVRMGSRRTRRFLRPLHAVLYEAFFGSIPLGLVPDHTCRVRDCVNVLHLEPMTSGENVLRGMAPAAVNARKSRCYRGHEFDRVQRRRNGRMRRICSTCRSEWKRRRRVSAVTVSPETCQRLP
jgi:hypothetical protein